MPHVVFSLIPILVPLLVVGLILLIPRQILGGSFSKKMDSRLQETTQRTALWHQETQEFQQQLLDLLHKGMATEEGMACHAPTPIVFRPGGPSCS